MALKKPQYPRYFLLSFCVLCMAAGSLWGDGPLFLWRCYLGGTAGKVRPPLDRAAIGARGNVHIHVPSRCETYRGPL